jgi:hypothetical protein
MSRELMLLYGAKVEAQAGDQCRYMSFGQDPCHIQWRLQTNVEYWKNS